MDMDKWRNDTDWIESHTNIGKRVDTIMAPARGLSCNRSCVCCVFCGAPKRSWRLAIAHVSNVCVLLCGW
jgi:hypothetical protein